MMKIGLATLLDPPGRDIVRQQRTPQADWTAGGPASREPGLSDARGRDRRRRHGHPTPDLIAVLRLSHQVFHAGRGFVDDHR